MHKICAGIDVGLSSAAAAAYGYVNGSNLPKLIATTDIRTIGEKAAKRIDVLWLRDWLVGTGATVAYVERGSARSMQGAMSNYLRACGQIEATVTLAGLHGVLVPPGVWQRAIGLTDRRRACATDLERDKASVVLARELFPERADLTFKFWNSHNEAEAAEIALYAALRLDLVSLKAAA